MLPITVLVAPDDTIRDTDESAPTVIRHRRSVSSYARDDDDHVRPRYNASVPSHNADDSHYRSLKTGVIIVGCLVNGASARAAVRPPAHADERGFDPTPVADSLLFRVRALGLRATVTA